MKNLIGLVGALAVAGMGLITLSAQAGGTIDTFTVTSTADTQTAGTLRQAILDANGSAATEARIDFDLADGSVVLLGSNLPMVSHPNVQIRNLQPDNHIAIDGDSSYRLFQQLGATASISVSDLEMRNGLMTASTASNGGACLYTQGRALLLDVRFVDCTTINGSGGAVHARNNLLAERSHFSGNRVFHDGQEGYRGGAIYCTGAFCNISESNLVDNGVFTQLVGQTARGGGAAALYADQNTVEASRFIDNSGAGRGGALYVLPSQDGSFLQVNESTFRTNSAGEGGSIYIASGDTNQSVILDRNSFDRNTVALRGSAVVISAIAQVSVRGNVFAMNDSTNNNVAFGALWIFSNGAPATEATLDFNSFAANDEQGYLFQIAESAPADVTVSRMHANIFDQRATTRAACVEDNAQLNPQSGAFNVVTDDSCTGSIEADSLVNVDPLLKENIRPDLTIVYPAADSPAIDLVTSEALVACSGLTDLDGTTRPLDGDDDGFSECDAGAVERNVDLFSDRFEN